MVGGVISRVDVDNSEEGARKKKNRRKKQDAANSGAAPDEKQEEEEKKEEEVVVVPEMPLGINECRVTTTARCNHNAHGSGFRVEIWSDDGRQRCHFFTTTKDLPCSAWHSSLTEAVSATGSRAMLGRSLEARREGADDKAGQDEDEWLSTLMGKCMVEKPKAATRAEQADAGEAVEQQPAGEENGQDAAAPAPPKPKKEVPPW